MHLVMLQVSEDDMTEASEKRSAGVMAMSEGEVVFLCYVYCSMIRTSLIYATYVVNFSIVKNA